MTDIIINLSAITNVDECEKYPGEWADLKTANDKPVEIMSDIEGI